MAAPIGNQFWKARATHGRDLIFKSPELLWESCEEYFQHVEENPLWESKVFCYQGDVIEATVPKMRAMTVEGLCLFLEISYQTWRDYAARDDFVEVTRKAEATIRQQKFAGAAADLLNANIIARDLGLSDKHDHTSSDGSMSPKGKSLDDFYADTGQPDKPDS